MSEPPSLILTGGTGFVGGYLAPRLAADFPHYRRVMVVATSDTPRANPNWQFEPLDLTDEAAVDIFIARYRPTIIVHMAAQSSVGQAHQAAEATWRVNVIGSFNLARAVGRHSPSSLVFYTSSGDVYGSSCMAGPASEDTPAAPMNSYSLSKLAAERILEDILPPETRLIITRAFNHSGAGHDQRFVLPSFAAQIARAENGAAPPVIRVGNLAAQRDFLHVSDVVEAYFELIRMADTLPMRNTFNVASGETLALNQILELMLSKSRLDISIVQDPARMRPSDTPKIVGDSSRLRRVTGWAPKLGIEAIVEDLLGCFRGAET
jgi:GDP-4-dehydro-6-deoxy-D-mannose reductase